MKELSQKKKFVRRNIKFTEKQVFYSVKNKGKLNEVEIPFEELLKVKTTVETENRIWLIVSGVLFIVGSLYLTIPPESSYPTWFKLILLFSSGLSYYIWTTSKQKYWRLKLTSKDSIYILKNVPNQNVVNDFIRKLYEHRDIYLKKEYGHINSKLNYETQFNNLKFLKKIDVLTEKEYELKIKELENMFNRNMNTGFTGISEN